MYSPAQPPVDVKRLGEYLYRELQNISREMQSGIVEQIQLAELHAEPTRPRNGMIVRADGSDWNPSGGAGIYAYISGAWVKL